MMEGTDDEPLGRPSFQQNSAECESEPLFARHVEMPMAADAF